MILWSTVNFQVIVEILSKPPKPILARTVANQTGVIPVASFQSATATNHPLQVGKPQARLIKWQNLLRPSSRKESDSFPSNSLLRIYCWWWFSSGALLIHGMNQLFAWSYKTHPPGAYSNWEILNSYPNSATALLNWGMISAVKGCFGYPICLVWGRLKS